MDQQREIDDAIQGPSRPEEGEEELRRELEGLVLEEKSKNARTEGVERTATPPEVPDVPEVGPVGKAGETRGEVVEMPTAPTGIEEGEAGKARSDPEKREGQSAPQALAE